MEVLDAVVEYLRKHGVPELALRPLAAELNTSTYTFVYHFGSKDGLLAEAFEQLAETHEQTLRSWGKLAPAAAVRRLWRWAIHEDELATVKLAIDAQAMSRHDGSTLAPFADRVAAAWLGLFTASAGALGATSEEATSRATAVAGAVRGILADLLATDDRDRCDAAIEQLATDLQTSRGG